MFAAQRSDRIQRTSLVDYVDVKTVYAHPKRKIVHTTFLAIIIVTALFR